MAKKVKSSKIIRFEYTVINDKFYVEVENNQHTVRRDDEVKLVEYWDVYLKRGTHGMKRFLYGCPVVSWETSERVSTEEVIEDVECLLLSSIVDYIKEEEAIENYYASLDEEC